MRVKIVTKGNQVYLVSALTGSIIEVCDSVPHAESIAHYRNYELITI